MCKLMEDRLIETEKMKDCQFALKMLIRGKLTLDEIVEDSGLTLEEVKEIAEENNIVTA